MDDRRCGERAARLLTGLLAASSLGIGCAGAAGRNERPPQGPVPVLHVAVEQPHVAVPEPVCVGDTPCDGAPAIAKAGPPLPCSNGSLSDCNAPGTTLIPESAWVDPDPPAGWQQCAGFVNTEGNDVTHDFLDGCLHARRLRVRVWTPGGELEEDVSAGGMPPVDAWPSWNYLGGSYVLTKKTHWGDTTFFTATDGKDACMKVAAPGGTTFGSGYAGVAIVAGGNRGADEYRISCEGKSLPGRRIALYRDPVTPLRRAADPAP